MQRVRFQPVRKEKRCLSPPYVRTRPGTPAARNRPLERIRHDGALSTCLVREPSYGLRDEDRKHQR